MRAIRLSATSLKPAMQRVIVGALSGTLAAFVIALLAVPRAQAQFDHLKCYKIKDQRQFAEPFYDADLMPEQSPPFDPEHCVIKTKAKFFCIDVQKENVTPPPPGAPPGPDAADYLCYKFKVKCTPPVPAGMTVDVTDQFAAGPIEIKQAGMICTPTRKGTTSTTSTTTTTTTTTTTIPMFTCDPLTTPAPECDGSCPPGEVCVSQGFCAGTTIPCFSDGDCSPPGTPCIGMGPCDCIGSSGLPCGVLAGPPQCYGDCPPNESCRLNAIQMCQCF